MQSVLRFVDKKIGADVALADITLFVLILQGYKSMHRTLLHLYDAEYNLLSGSYRLLRKLLKNSRCRICYTLRVLKLVDA